MGAAAFMVTSKWLFRKCTPTKAEPRTRCTEVFFDFLAEGPDGPQGCPETPV